jgi:hypothetical protein
VEECPNLRIWNVGDSKHYATALRPTPSMLVTRTDGPNQTNLSSHRVIIASLVDSQVVATHWPFINVATVVAFSLVNTILSSFLRVWISWSGTLLPKNNVT